MSSANKGRTESGVSYHRLCLCYARIVCIVSIDDGTDTEWGMYSRKLVDVLHTDQQRDRIGFPAEDGAQLSVVCSFSFHTKLTMLRKNLLYFYVSLNVLFCSLFWVRVSWTTLLLYDCFVLIYCIEGFCIGFSSWSYSMKFNGYLRLRIGEAMDLKPTTFSTRHTFHKKIVLDPYIVVKVDNVKVGQTATKAKTNKPTFNDEFCPYITNGKELELSVFHNTPIGYDDFVANYRIQLEELITSSNTRQTFEGWVSLLCTHMTGRIDCLD